LAPFADVRAAALGVLADLVADRPEVLAVLAAPVDRLPDLVAGRLVVLLAGTDFPLALRPPRGRHGRAA
jgi:hypothetical protein